MYYLLKCIIEQYVCVLHCELSNRWSAPVWLTAAVIERMTVKKDITSLQPQCCQAIVCVKLNRIEVKSNFSHCIQLYYYADLCSDHALLRQCFTEGHFFKFETNVDTEAPVSLTSDTAVNTIAKSPRWETRVCWGFSCSGSGRGAGWMSARDTHEPSGLCMFRWESKNMEGCNRGWTGCWIKSVVELRGTLSPQKWLSSL